MPYGLNNLGMIFCQGVLKLPDLSKVPDEGKKAEKSIARNLSVKEQEESEVFAGGQPYVEITENNCTGCEKPENEAGGKLLLHL